MTKPLNNSPKKQETMINRVLQVKKKQMLKFSHVHPLVPELASGLGPSLECSRVVEMLEKGEKMLI